MSDSHQQNLGQKIKEIEGINHEAVDALTNAARQKTWQAIKDVSSMIRPGMTETQAIGLANQYFADHGVKKFWHRSHVRFGESTVLSFDDPYKTDIVLKDDDIYFLDFGPVWNGVEGDCGDTFVVGNSYKFKKIRQDLVELFEVVRSQWKAKNLRGDDIYKFAGQKVEQMGYLLHPSYVKGHRLSEFSHAKYSKIGLAELDFSPMSERWVLEFQICDQSLKYGAFYEDLLI